MTATIRSLIKIVNAPAPAPVHSRIEIIEGLRGLAAFAVAWFHFTNANAAFPTLGWLRASGTYGWLGVESFFVISGFIIPYAMRRTGYRVAAWPTFLAKRLLRLEPSYLVSILLTLALWWVSSRSPGFTREPPGAAQVLLHIAYLPALFGYPWLDAAYWTLAIEFQYYLLSAVAFSWIAHASARVRLAGFSAACLLPFVVTSDNLVFRYLSLFALGIATFWKHSGWLSGGGYLALLAAAAAVTSATLGPAIAAVGTGTALLMAYGNRFRWRPLAWMGTLSYSLYLIHGPVGERVVNLGARYAHAPVAQVAVMVAAVVVSVGAAYALYRLVELPALRAAASLRYKRGHQSPVRD
ncbi:MAG: acyltransferase [Acidobacteriota bacterium]